MTGEQIMQYMDSIPSEHLNKIMKSRLFKKEPPLYILSSKLLKAGGPRSYSFTEFTGNAAFLSSWITTEGMLSTKTGTQRTFFKGVIDLHHE